MKKTLLYGDGQTLSYAEYGDPAGYPVLVQHGLIASIEDEGLFDALLRLGTRVICIARPGYGDSSPYEMASFGEWGEIVGALVSALGLGSFDVLGISSGAPYSYAIGAKLPEKARTPYIFSGMPALYDAVVQAHWPYGVIEETSMADLQTLAHVLFFADLPEEALAAPDVRDAMAHHGFGVALDLKLRFADWGFLLSEVLQPVYMRHSKADDSVPYETAVRTAALLPNCTFDLTETGPHFSREALDDFIVRTMAVHLPQALESGHAACGALGPRPGPDSS